MDRLSYAERHSRDKIAYRGLSTLVLNTLHRAGVTPERLPTITREELLKIPNFGETSLRQVAERWGRPELLLSRRLFSRAPSAEQRPSEFTLSDEQAERAINVLWDLGCFDVDLRTYDCPGVTPDDLRAALREAFASEPEHPQQDP